MGPYKGDFTTSDTVYFFFDTFSSDDPSASITLTGLATSDIEVYRDGGTTQRASDAGYTLLDTDGIDFDGITGIHGFSIDLSDNTDAGFYTTTGEFDVIVSSVTVDGATINFHAGSFSIDRIPRVNVHQISDDATAATNAESFFDGTGYAGTNNTIPTVTNVTNQVTADVTAISGDTTAANNLESDYDGTGYNKSASTIGTTTTNTDMRGTDNAFLAANAPTNFSDLSITVTTGRVDVASIEGSDATDQIRDAVVDDATRIDASALNTLSGFAPASTIAAQSDVTGLNDLSPAEVNAEVDTALGDYDAPTYDELEGFIQLLARSDAAIATDRSALLTAINANEGSGAGDFDNTSEALEAIRDRGDAAWITGGGGALTQIIKPFFVVPTSIDLANTATVRFGIVLTNAVDDLPTTAEITPGTITIARKAIGGTSWSAVVSAAAMSEQDGMVYYDEVFDSGSGYAEGDSIRVQFESVSVTADANTFNVTGATGVFFQTFIRETERGTDSAFLAANAPANFADLSITASTGRVDVASIEGSDATDQIRDAVVDDATRIDASALNTASAAIGSDGTGLTEAGGTGDQLTTITDLIGNISAGSAGISTIAGSFTPSGAEPETNTYTATHELDSTYHIVEDVANATDGYYQFDIGPNGVPVEFEWVGYAQGNNATYAIYAYNYTGTTYEQIGSVIGTSGATVQTKTFSLTTAHVGTGANDGLVRFRILSADGAAFATDHLLATYTVIDTALGYEDGAVWVDEASGTSSGTTPGVDGLVTNRSDDFDNAQDIADALGYTAIYVTNGNTITLSDTINNYVIGQPGSNWTIALGGQDISNCDINDAAVSGVGAGSNVHFHNCLIGTATLPPGEMYSSGFSATMTGLAGDYDMVNPRSQVAGSGSPVFTWAAVGSTTNINVRGYFGGGQWTFNAFCTASIEVVKGGGHTITTGGGDVEFRGFCRSITVTSSGSSTTQIIAFTGPITINGTGGTVNVYGQHSGITDNSGGSVTINDISVDGNAVGSNIAAILADSNELQTDWTNGGRLDLILDELTTQGDTNEGKIDTIDTNVDAVLVDTGTTLPAQISGLNDVSVTDILTTQMTESYAADGAAPTITQALMLIQQMLGDFTISGTTLTVREVDGSTTAATFTLNDGSTPTALTRAS